MKSTENKAAVLSQINAQLTKGLIDRLGIEIVDFEEDMIVGTMPVDERTMRPGGILHGGSNLVLAETMAGVGSMLFIDTEAYNALGISVSANHVGTATGGTVRAVAQIVHKGRTTHLWNVDIFNEDDKLISTAKITNMIVEK